MKKHRNIRKEKKRSRSIQAESIDMIANAVVETMSPLQMGKLIYPDAEPVNLPDVPEPVIRDHAARYTDKELKAGQFFRVHGKYTFFMDHDAKKTRTQTPYS